MVGKKAVRVFDFARDTGFRMSADAAALAIRVDRLEEALAEHVLLQALGKEGLAHKTKSGRYNFPIVDRRDLLDAILAIGRTDPGERFSVKRWIVYRAKLLGMKSDVPNAWIAEVGEAVTA